ncbi:hypothetical protein ACFY5F_35950 [Streptomyces sp. NPDC013161]|uniref:hypothetical protein n=1 Tax=Streptomyces sp. NPDC013161 TaxID=3364862 RepID=UPI00368789A7
MSEPQTGDGPAARTAVVAAGSRQPVLDLHLAKLCLRLIASKEDALRDVEAMLSPPCTAQPPTGTPDWTMRIEEALQPATGDEETFEGPELVFPQGGPRLSVVDSTAGRLRLYGRYLPDGAAASIDTDTAAKTTRIVLPTRDKSAARLADWLAKGFFASRLLGTGWQMLHASAVVVAGQAILFLAGQRGGKSTLAHRACAELGAMFLADDLILLGPDGTVAGWPARVCLPVDLPVPHGVGEVFERIVDGDVRRRVRLTPPEHRQALGIGYSPPVPLGAVINIALGANSGSSSVHASPLERDALTSVVEKALDIPSQRHFTSDLLGLTGSGNTAPPTDATSSVLRLLSRKPGVHLTVGDPVALPTVAVWRELSAILPSLTAGAR